MSPRRAIRSISRRPIRALRATIQKPLASRYEATCASPSRPVARVPTENRDRFVLRLPRLRLHAVASPDADTTLVEYLSALEPIRALAEIHARLGAVA